MGAATTGVGTPPTADGHRLRDSESAPAHATARRAPGGGLLAVIGPVGPSRMSLLRGLGDRQSAGGRAVLVRAGESAAPASSEEAAGLTAATGIRLRAAQEGAGAASQLRDPRMGEVPDPALVGPNGPHRGPDTGLGGAPRAGTGAARDGEGANPGAVTANAPLHEAVLPDPCLQVGELLSLASLRTGQRAEGDPTGRSLAAVGLTVSSGSRDDVPGALPSHARYADLHPADQLLLALALALLDTPAALLVDSAGEGLDAGGRHRVWSALRRIAASGTPVVASCDSAETAGVHAHRTVLLPHLTGVGGRGHGHH
ncbi:hypothetical protein ABZW18_19715 [Streptomyces sp. NPDC004647]|uniref:hypothetical protein n=1 Tax=Streptomyces sp. NPDC004647 TaxID=3154671 RepID=UPI0033ADEB71